MGKSLGSADVLGWNLQNLILFVCFLRQSLTLTQTSLDLTAVILPCLPEDWDYRHELTSLTTGLALNHAELGTSYRTYRE